jgi:hypothetical protein
MARLRLAILLLVGVIVLLPVAGRAVGPPEIAFTRPAGGVSVSDRNGAEIASFGGLSGRYSLDGDVLAGLKRHGNVVVFNAISGEEIDRIKSALSPVVLLDGSKVAFIGNFKRDKQVNSLWLRNVGTGGTRKVVQFSNGGGLPGVKTKFHGENTFLEVSFDDAAETAAVVEGNDLDLFIYDVWLIDVTTGEATRVTEGRRSRHASVSPDGHHVALFREDKDPECGGPPPGYRSGDIVVIDDGAEKRVVVDGACDAGFFDDPRWINNVTLVARRVTRVDGQELRDSELVLIDVASGVVSPPLSVTDRVGTFTASPSLDLIAYDDFTSDGLWIYNVSTTMTVLVPNANFPHLSGENRTIY